MVIFAKRVAHLAEVTGVVDPDGTTVVYSVTGELFFASSNDLVDQFDYASDPDNVVIDLSGAHIWDASSVAALDAIETKYAQRGKTVKITGLNEPSAQHPRHARRPTRRRPLMPRTDAGAPVGAAPLRPGRRPACRSASRRAGRAEHPHHPALRGGRPDRRPPPAATAASASTPQPDLDRLAVVKR